MRRDKAKRDQALILVLLDTGLRASELTSLNIDDMEMRTGKIHIKHRVQGGARVVKAVLWWTHKVGHFLRVYKGYLSATSV